MNYCLEFHDSDVDKIEVGGKSLKIFISEAMVHASIERPGIDAGAVYTQAVEIEFIDPRWDGAIDLCVGWIADGVVISKGISTALLELPYISTNDVSVNLRFTKGELLSVNARKMTCLQIGEPKFLQLFSP
jgi:hypothetical protein